MSEITATGEKTMVLASGRAHPELAREIAQELGTELLPIDAYDFANGEIYVRAGRERARNRRVCDSGPPGTDEQLADGAVDYD